MPVLNSATADDQNVLGAEIHCTTRRTIVIVVIEIIYYDIVFIAFIIVHYFLLVYFITSHLSSYLIIL